MNRTEGFTLIELLIVIAIIGILAAVLIPNLLGAQRRAYDTGALSCGKSIQTAMATLQVDKQDYSSAATTPALLALGSVNAVCAVPTMVIGNPVVSQNDYSFTIQDTRGSKTYTVTPSSITGR